MKDNHNMYTVLTVYKCIIKIKNINNISFVNNTNTVIKIQRYNIIHLQFTNDSDNNILD